LISGKLLFEKTLAVETNLDLSAYASGIYLLKIYDASKKERLSQKVIKE